MNLHKTQNPRQAATDSPFQQQGFQSYFYIILLKPFEVKLLVLL